MNITNLTDSQGNLVSIDIELIESAGPVSPEYQYNLQLHLKNEGNHLRINYSYEGKYIYGVPEVKKSFDEVVPNDKSTKILQNLLDLNPLGIHIDLKEDTKKSVGISFNELNLQIGANEKTKVLYTLSNLSKPNFATQSKIITFLKKLENWKDI